MTLVEVSFELGQSPHGVLAHLLAERAAVNWTLETEEHGTNITCCPQRCLFLLGQIAVVGVSDSVDFALVSRSTSQTEPFLAGLVQLVQSRHFRIRQ